MSTRRYETVCPRGDNVFETYKQELYCDGDDITHGIAKEMNLDQNFLGQEIADCYVLNV